MIYIENLDFGYQKKQEVFSGLNLSLTGGIFMACLERMEPVRLLY